MRFLTRLGGEATTALERVVQEHTNLDGAHTAAAMVTLHVLARRATTPERGPRGGANERRVPDTVGDGRKRRSGVKLGSECLSARPIGIEFLPDHAPL